MTGVTASDHHAADAQAPDDAPLPGDPAPPDDPALTDPAVPVHEAPDVQAPDHPAPPDGDAPPATTLVARSTLRRAPRYGRFALAGFAVGAVLAALAAILGPPGTILGRGAIFLLVLLAFGSAGALTGSVLAVVSDRRSLRRRRDGS